jgi:hypothetical protein
VGRLELDADRSEAAVVGLVLRRVGEEVVGAQLLVDLGEPDGKVVGVPDQEGAGLVGEAPEAALGREPQGILALLEEGEPARDAISVPRPQSPGLVRPVGPETRLEHVEGSPRFGGRALGVEAAGIDGVDADARAVGSRHDRAEGRLDPGRDHEALGEEDDGLSAGQLGDSAHQGQEGVGGGKALLVSFQPLVGLHQTAVHQLEAADHVVLDAPALGHPDSSADATCAWPGPAAMPA